MNIFYLDHDPKIAAQYMVDKHVVKMIVESAQMLSTAHRVLDGTPIITRSKPNTYKTHAVFKLPDYREDVCYKTTHINHPSAKWCRLSRDNYLWLFNHFVALMEEYEYRYGKHHKCWDMVTALENPPTSLVGTGFIAPPSVMDEEYLVGSISIKNYQNYYKFGKQHIHSWKKRNMPDWIK